MEHTIANKGKLLKIALIVTVLVFSIAFFANKMMKGSTKSKASSSCNAGLQCANNTVCGVGGHCALGIDGVPEIGRCLCAETAQNVGTGTGESGTTVSGSTAGGTGETELTYEMSRICPMYSLITPPSGCHYESNSIVAPQNWSDSQFYAGKCPPAPQLVCDESRDCTGDMLCGEGKSCVQNASMCTNNPVPDGQGPGGLGHCYISMTCKSDTQQITDQTLWWFDDSIHMCQEKIFTGTYMYAGLQTFKTKEECINALRSKYNIACPAYDMLPPAEGCQYEVANGVDGVGCQLPPKLVCHESRICQNDGFCGTDQECYQPPMPDCAPGMSCIQVMPQRICRQIPPPICQKIQQPEAPEGCTYVNDQFAGPSASDSSVNKCPVPPYLTCNEGRVCQNDGICGVNQDCVQPPPNCTGDACTSAFFQKICKSKDVSCPQAPAFIAPGCHYETTPTLPGQCPINRLICDVGRDCRDDNMCGEGKICKSDCPDGTQCFQYNAKCQDITKEICSKKPIPPPPYGCYYEKKESTPDNPCPDYSLICNIDPICSQDSDCPSGQICYQPSIQSCTGGNCPGSDPQQKRICVPKAFICPAKMLANPPPGCEYIPKEPTPDNPCPDAELKCEGDQLLCDANNPCPLGKVCVRPAPTCPSGINCTNVYTPAVCKDQIADADGDGKVCLSDYAWIQNAFNGMYDKEEDKDKKIKDRTIVCGNPCSL